MGLFDFFKPKPPKRGYWTLIRLIQEAHGDEERLALCEEALPLLPGFVSDYLKTDNELPPVVPPRDMLPEMYMRFGEWGKARETVDFCLSVGAYQHGEHSEIKKDIFNRQAATEGLLKFLRENPGFLQKDIYKTPVLAALDHDALVWACRSFHLIRKEKSGKTNKLYIN